MLNLCALFSTDPQPVSCSIDPSRSELHVGTNLLIIASCLGKSHFALSFYGEMKACRGRVERMVHVRRFLLHVGPVKERLSFVNGAPAALGSRFSLARVLVGQPF